MLNRWNISSLFLKVTDYFLALKVINSADITITNGDILPFYDLDGKLCLHSFMFWLYPKNDYDANDYDDKLLEECPKDNDVSKCIKTISLDAELNR